MRGGSRSAVVSVLAGLIALVAAVLVPSLASAQSVFRTGPAITDGPPREVVHLSENGERMLSTSLSVGAGLFDSSDRDDIEQLAQFPLDSTNSAAFGANDGLILAAHITGSGENQTPRLTVLRRTPEDDLAQIAVLPLPAQPDAIEVSPDGAYAAIAIEDEDEELPGGVVVIIRLVDEMDPSTWTAHEVPIVLDGSFPQNTEPQPEYVDFNDDNEVAFSIQEQNAIGILDAEAAADGDPGTDPIVRIFDAGTTNFSDDLTADNRFNPNPATPLVTAREPDAVAWTADGQSIVAVAEGEATNPHEWMIYNRDGTLTYSSGFQMHLNAALFGLHPVNFQGSQPEGVTVETFEGREYVFFVTERTANLSVYDISSSLAAPEFVGTYPTGIRPETVAFSPANGLAVTGNETDVREPGSTLLALDPDQVDRNLPLLRGDEPWANLRGLGASSTTKQFAITGELPHKLRTIDLSTRGEAEMTTLAPLPGAATTEAVEDVVPDGEGGVWIGGPVIELMNVSADGTLKRSINLPDDLDPIGVTRTSDGAGLVVIEAGNEAGYVNLADDAVTRFNITSTVPGAYTDLATAPDGRIIAMRANAYNANNGPGATALVSFPANTASGQTVASTAVETITPDEQSPYASDRLTALTISPNGDVWYAHGAFLTPQSGSDPGLRRLPKLLAPEVVAPADAGLPSSQDSFDNLVPFEGFRALQAGGDLFAAAEAGTPLLRDGAPLHPNLTMTSADTGRPVSGGPDVNADGQVTGIVSDGAGGAYVSGFFGTVNGAARSGVAHLQADGSVDPGFAPTIDGGVSGVAFEAGRVWIGGYFENVNGSPRPNFAALEPNGTLSPGVDLPASAGVNLIYGAAGKVYVAADGIFTVGGTDRREVARVDASTATVDPWDPAPDSSVAAIAVDGSNVILGGDFENVDDPTVPARRLAIVNGSDGALVTDLNASSRVVSLSVAGRSLFAAGFFQQLNGAPAVRFGAIDLDSPTNVRTFASGQGLNPGASISLVKPLSNGGLLISGGFRTVGGERRSGLALIDQGSFELEPSFDGVVSSNGSASAALQLAPNRLLIGGSYSALGQATPGSLLQIDEQTGEIDESFMPSPIEPSSIEADEDFIYSLNSTSGVERFDRFTGERDPSWAITVAPLDGSAVRDSELLFGESGLYLVGDELRVINGTTRPGIGAVDRETAELLPFNPRTNGQVSGAALSPDGRLFIVGDFTAARGEPAGGVAEVDPVTGALLPTFAGISLGSESEAFQRSVTLDAEGETLYVDRINGVNGQPAGGIVAFDVSGSSASRVTAFAPQFQNAGSLQDLDWVGGRLIVSGSVNQVNGTPTGPLFALTPAGELDRRFAPAVDNNDDQISSFGSRIVWGGKLFDPAAPSNLTLPSVTGTPQEGHVLTCTEGTFDGAPESFEYRWLRGGTPISGATARTYTPVAADVGSQLSCEVTASNQSGEATVSSAAVAVSAGIPVSSAPPAITGNPVAGQTLTAGNGGWSNSPTSFAYQWLRNGTAIVGATSQTYVLVGADAGTNIKVQVVATNLQGDSSPAESAATQIVAVPDNQVPPAISGTVAVGQPLTASTGQWTQSPTSYSYEWRRDGVGIAGATGATYTPVVADEGADLSVAVTATNAAGTSATAVSGSVEVPSPGAPTSVTRAVISGSAEIGSLLTCNRGQWQGAEPVTFSHRWLRSGGVIDGATGETYRTTEADVGFEITCQVTASNRGGSTTDTSLPVRPERPQAADPTPTPDPTEPRPVAALDPLGQAKRGKKLAVMVETDGTLRGVTLELVRNGTTIGKREQAELPAPGAQLTLKIRKKAKKGPAELELVARDVQNRLVVATAEINVK